jgi:uncharacterized protein YggE
MNGMLSSRRTIITWLAAAGWLLANCAGQTNPEVANGNAGSSESQQPRTVQVSAAGSVQAEPDTAVIQLGVETLNPQAQPAIESNRRRMQAVQAALTDQGIAASDMQTVQFNVNVEQIRPDTPDGEMSPRFRVTHILRVQTDQIATVGDLLQAALDAGANRVQSVQFSLADPTGLESEARAQALAAARDKATELAAGLDAQVGPVRQITESGGGTPRPIMAAAAESSASVPIAAGSLSITVSVNVTFDLIPAP